MKIKMTITIDDISDTYVSESSIDWFHYEVEDELKSQLEQMVERIFQRKRNQNAKNKDVE
jgi:histidinol dehydrogenase